jgi:hypothetical protein
MTDKRFVKDVAKELDRRHLRRKIVVLGGATAAIVLAVMYLRCGHGWGLGGEGAGSGAGSGPGSAVAAKRCEIRVAKAGITVDGHAVTREAAVVACKPLGAADVIVTGDAREGDWEALRQALEAAKLDIALRRPR